jgi:hypothetical protein
LTNIEGDILYICHNLLVLNGIEGAEDGVWITLFFNLNEHVGGGLTGPNIEKKFS